MVYYSYIWIVSYASIWITTQILEYVWYNRTVVLDANNSYNYVNNIPQLIAFHQITTFVVLTSHNAWFGGVLFKEVDPLAVAVIQFFITWVVWGIFANHTLGVNNLG